MFENIIEQSEDAPANWGNKTSLKSLFQFYDEKKQDDKNMIFEDGDALLVN